MDKLQLEAFSAIVAFVKELSNVFGHPTKVTPLSLYSRMIDHIKFTDKEAIRKSISGFSDFFTRYGSVLELEKLSEIPRGTTILYGTNERVYIDIQKFIYQADAPTKECILRHLLTIYAILEPDSNRLDKLQKITNGAIDSSTPEGDFINTIVNKAQTAMKGIETDNPATAMMGLFNSGILGDMMGGLKTGVESGKMDMRKLLGTMQGALNTMIANVDANLPATKSEEKPNSV